MGFASSKVFANAPIGEPGAELDPAGATSDAPGPASEFDTGERRRTPGIVGAVVCLSEVGGYYATAAEHGHPTSLAPVPFWEFDALVGGQLFGMAGWMWRSAAGLWLVAALPCGA